MEPISTILFSALGFILKAAGQSKTVQTAKEEILSSFWHWIRPKFINDVPEVESAPDAAETQIKAEEKLLELVKDEDFFNELAKRVNELQKAGIKEKNIIQGDIEQVKNIRIGDKEYHPGEVYDNKNIIKGNIKKAGDLIIGDGY